MASHPNELGGRPVHESDRKPTGTMRGKSYGGLYEIAHCRHCGDKMTRPIKAKPGHTDECGVQIGRRCDCGVESLGRMF